MIAPELPPYLRALRYQTPFSPYGVPGWLMAYGGFIPPMPGGFMPPPVPQFTMQLPPGPSTGRYVPDSFNTPGPMPPQVLPRQPGMPVMRHQYTPGPSPIMPYSGSNGPFTPASDPFTVLGRFGSMSLKGLLGPSGVIDLIRQQSAYRPAPVNPYGTPRGPGGYAPPEIFEDRVF